METNKSTIGSRIRDLRIRKGMTQEDLARAVGYTSRSSKSTINKIETGHTDVVQSKLPLYAKALGVSVVDLLGITDESENGVSHNQSPDEILAFALFGDSSVVTAEDLADIRKFADYIKARRNDST